MESNEVLDALTAELMEALTAELMEVFGLEDDPEVSVMVSVPTTAPQILWTDPFDLRAEVLNVVWSDEAAVVEVLVQYNDTAWVVKGTSKRLSGDQANAQIGIGLAVGRAFEALSRQLLRQANGLVKHNDDNRQKRKAVAAAKIKAKTDAAKKDKKAKAK